MAQPIFLSKSIDRYLPSGLTVLLFALSVCTPAVVRETLNCHQVAALINAPSQNGKLTPLGICISRMSPELVSLVLSNSARAYEHVCGVVKVTGLRVPLDEYSGGSGLIGNPILYAYDVYVQHNKNHLKEYAEIIASLLHFGGCLGFKFTSEFMPTTLPPYVVAIGGSFPKSPSTQVVTCLEEFKKVVPKKDYSHWKNILEQFVQYIMHDNPHRIKLDEYQSVIDFIKKTLQDSASFTGQRTHIGSPISSSGEVHEKLLQRTLEVIKDRKDFQYFIDSIHQKHYAQALRRLCTTKNPECFPIALELAELLLSLKSQLHFEINEKAGNPPRSALHSAEASVTPQA